MSRWVLTFYRIKLKHLWKLVWFILWRIYRPHGNYPGLLLECARFSSSIIKDGIRILQMWGLGITIIITFDDTPVWQYAEMAIRSNWVPPQKLYRGRDWNICSLPLAWKNLWCPSVSGSGLVNTWQSRFPWHTKIIITSVCTHYSSNMMKNRYVLEEQNTIGQLSLKTFKVKN